MIFILRLVILFFLIESIVGMCFFNKNPRKYFLLFLDFVSGIFVFLPVFLPFYYKQTSFLDSLPFILFGLVFYVSTLILLCIDLINKKKSVIYKEVQDRIDNWK